MGPQVINNFSSVLIAQIIFIMLLMFPDFSLLLWKSIIKKWTLTGEKMMTKRTRAAEEKLKKYWEIDMRKFK
jgi:hypothetical protein